MYVVLEGRNSIRQHTKKGPEKDRQRGKGERPAETKATRDGKKKEKKMKKTKKKKKQSKGRGTERNRE